MALESRAFLQWEVGDQKIIRRGSVDKLIYPAITYIGAASAALRASLGFPMWWFFLLINLGIDLLFCCFPVSLFSLCITFALQGFISTPAAGAGALTADKMKLPWSLQKA